LSQKPRILVVVLVAIAKEDTFCGAEGELSRGIGPHIGPACTPKRPEEGVIWLLAVESEKWGVIIDNFGWQSID
jgi:hypothetical protein